jgi:DNA polymerase III sliding clamp (beta) subunit (PCNA family)
VNAVRNFLKRAGGDVTLYDGDSYYFFEDDSGDYFGFKKVDYSFPDLSSIKPFDTDIKTVVKVDREVLKAAVTRLKWSLDDDQRRMGFEIQGESDCTLRLFTKNTKGAVSEETVDDGVLRTAGKDDVEFYVNYEYILKGLSKFPVDVVTLYIHKSRGFSYVKMLTDKADGDSTISQALLLALMKKPKG